MKRSLALSVAAVAMWMTASAGLLIPLAYADSCAVDVRSTPSGADVYVNGIFVGRTPVFYTIGFPTTANVTVTMDGYERWSELVVVPLNAHVPVDAMLTPLADGAVTVTRTVTTTVTTTSPTTVTSTTTATTISTTILTTTSATTITTATTVTSTQATQTVTSMTTAPASTVTTTREVTETIGMPAEVTYSAVGIAVIAIIITAFLATRKK